MLSAPNHKTKGTLWLHIARAMARSIGRYSATFETKAESERVCDGAAIARSIKP
jgi:hypothetical protein